MSSHEVRLLLVDDDPSEIQVMSRMLAEYPDQRFATSGEAALRLARESTPDLILLDIGMPDMTGLDVCEALKGDPVLAQVPVIFVTSHGTPGLEVIGMQGGARDFITKPLVAEQLTARVRAQLGTKGQADDPNRGRPAGNTGAAPAPSSLPRLLIVDDDIAAIHVLCRALAEMGDLHFAKSGQEALQLARQLIPDLILLDAHMPGIDGFDVCRCLKAEAPFKHMPIVFVTRFSDPAHEMRAFDVGAADFIAKPYTAAVLRARVRNLLDLKQRNDAELRAVREHWRQIGDARVADIVGTASDAIVTCNAHDEVVLINNAACRMFGVGHEQTIGSPARALLGDLVFSDERAHADSERTTMCHADGHRFPVDLSISAVGSGAARLTTVMLRDMGDRERLEAESRSRIEAETASRTKTLMISYLAHEMGNPLNGMLGFAQLMAADAAHPLGPAQAKRLEHVIGSGRHMESLMRDVLDLGRFETGKLTIALGPVNVARCTQQAAAAVSPLADPARVTLSSWPVAPSLHVTADADRLHQCLLNLLSNAVKYNRRGGWARVEVAADGPEIAIAVRDNGLGMDTAQRQHLFEPFNRLGRQRAAAPGIGLGLVITRQLVEAMNGQLRVESVPGQGSCFTIVLPGGLDTPAA